MFLISVYRETDNSSKAAYSQVQTALEKDVYPVLGKRSIVDITARDVLALLQKKERTAPELPGVLSCCLSCWRNDLCLM
ncbi:TPA: hypothetical protein KKL21_000382 [Escherichia coli]|nr:hypothetical protein [Escherichia coli]